MVAALISLVACAATSLAAEPRVVVPSGTLVSGVGLTRFRDPSPIGHGGILFRGTTEVVTLPDDAGGVRSVLTSGTPAPDLPGETINSFLDVESTPDGFIAVLADLNGRTVDTGIFVLESGRLSTVVSRKVDAGESLSNPDINAAGDLTFSADAGVFRRIRARGQTTLVVPTNSEGIPRRPRIDQGGALVWLTAGGLFHWSDATGTRVVARTGDSGPPGSGTITDLRRAAVHVTGGVAFIARTSSADGVFLWDPAREETRRLARVGDATDGGDIVRILPRVEFRPGGTVVFRAQVRARTRRIRWVVVSGETLTVSGGAGLATGGAASEVRESWYRRDGRRVTTVARIGDVVPGLGPVDALGRAAGSGASVVVAVTVAGLPVLVRAAGNGLEKIVADGEVVPKAGIVSLRDVEDPSPGFDAEGRTLAFASTDAVVVLREGRGARVVALPSPRQGDGGTFFPGAVFVRGGRVFVVGGFDAGRAGIFVARRNRLRALVLATDPAPVTPPAPFVNFSAVAPGARGIVFEAGADVLRLFRWTRGRITALRTDTGDPGAPLPVDAMASEGAAVIFATEDAIYRSLPGGAAPIVANAEVTALGTLGIGLDEAPAIAIVRGAVVFPAQLTGGPVRAALLARDLPVH